MTSCVNHPELSPSVVRSCKSKDNGGEVDLQRRAYKPHLARALRYLYPINMVPKPKKGESYPYLLWGLCPGSGAVKEHRFV